MEPDIFFHPRFAPVMPVVPSTQIDDQLFGNYHLLLAHDVVAHPKEYARRFEFLEGAKATLRVPELGSAKEPVVIMDNSVIELGKPVDIDMIREAASIVPATSCVVMPDVLFDRQATVRAIRNFINDWIAPLDGIELMAVPQGKDFNEWLWCLDDIVNLPEFRYISWIAAPKLIMKEFRTSRIDAVDAINLATGGQINIHLLGFSHNIFDDIRTAALGANVRGIDSAVPVRLGLRDDTRISLAMQGYPGRGDWWNKPGSNFKQAEDNIQLVHQWLGYEE